MHACFERYICVCGCMSVEEAVAGERRRECESDTKIIFTYLTPPPGKKEKKKKRKKKKKEKKKSSFLSPCFMEIFLFLCFAYW